VHDRISSPRIENPCYYGIDMSARQELIAANYDTEKMCALIEADSLAFLSPTVMESALIREKSINQLLCNACFIGVYYVLEYSEDNSLAFLSPTGMERSLIREKLINQGLCKACFTGDYPVLEHSEKKEFFRKY